MASTSKPKKKPFLTVGAPGPKSPVASASNLYPDKAPKPQGNILDSYGRAGPGRPKSNLGQYLIKPTPEQTSGFEMLNTETPIEQRVNAALKAFELPSALQPKYLRKPAVMETNRAKNISRGWRNPRGRA